MKRFLHLIALALSLPASAQTFTNSTGGPINDLATVTYSVTATGLPAQIDATFGLTTVCLDITHTYVADLQITLTSAAGPTIILSNYNGGATQDYDGTCFAMNGADGYVSMGSGPFIGTYVPDQSLNAFNNNQDPNGTWVLTITDAAGADIGTLHSFSITFGANPPADPPPPPLPCGITNGAGCFCPDSTQVCNLLPDMTASGLIIQQQHTETPGLLTLSNATPNIGWGPMEIHSSGSCFCDTVPVACTTTLCPDGNPPKEKLMQRVYTKNGNTISWFDTLTPGTMSYHPSHGHVHVDNWAEFTLRTPTSNPDATTWPIIAAGSKVSFCLINLGDCTNDYGYCVDAQNNIVTMADIPNAPFGLVSGCGLDQGIYTGNLDIYDQGLPGMDIDLTGVCNGSYYIVSITDPDNNFLETDDSNNWVAVPITLTQQMAAPNASFTYNINGSQVQFSNTPSVTSTYLWDFGDGSPQVTTQNPSHSYLVNGQYTVTLIVTNACGTDTFTNTVSITVGIEETEKNSAVGIAAHPNPSSGSIVVTYYIPGRSAVSIELYSLVGKKIHSIDHGVQEKGTHELTMDLNEAGIPAGAYLLRVQTPGKAATLRLVKLD
jgi:subtilisin-like proprotein convertase family protein